MKSSNIDLALQYLSIIPMIICYLLTFLNLEFLIFAFLSQIAVGIIQVLSSLFYSVTRKSSWHIYYFISVTF